MKKLLVIALSAIMVLSMAAVSMAAVTVGGEVNFGWNLSVANEATEDLDEFGDAKIKVTADVNDTVTVFTALKGDVGSVVGVDEAWASIKSDSVTTKVGYFGYNLDGDVDIIPSTEELKNYAGISVSGKVADAVTVSGYLARLDFNRPTIDLLTGVIDLNLGDDMESVYAVSVAYDTDSFGGKLTYATSTVEDAEAIQTLFGYYKLDAFKVFLDYEILGEDTGNNGILGVSYDSDSFYGLVEIQIVKTDAQDDADADASNGFRLGYKLGNGAKVEYNSKSIEGADAESSIKLKVEF